MKKSARKGLLLAAASLFVTVFLLLTFLLRKPSAFSEVDFYSFVMLFVLAFTGCGLPVFLIGVLILMFTSASEEEEIRAQAAGMSVKEHRKKEEERRAQAAGMSVKEHRKKILRESKPTFKEFITRLAVRILIGLLITGITLLLRELSRP